MAIPASSTTIIRVPVRGGILRGILRELLPLLCCGCVHGPGSRIGRVTLVLVRASRMGNATTMKKKTLSYWKLNGNPGKWEDCRPSENYYNSVLVMLHKCLTLFCTVFIFGWCSANNKKSPTLCNSCWSMNTNFFPWKLVSFSSSSYTQGMFKAIARPRRGWWSQPTYNQKAHFISIGAGRSDLSPPLPLRFASPKLPHFGFFFVLSLSHSTLLWLITFNGGHGHVGGFNFRLPSAACPMVFPLRYFCFPTSLAIRH